MINDINFDNNFDFEDLSNDNNIVYDKSLKIYFKEIGKYNLLTAEEENELLLKISQGDEKTKELLINSNLRLVVSIAKKYVRFGESMPFLDFIQEGNIGLMKAVEKFDISKNCKFSTYATFWIKQAITRAKMNKEKDVRIPVHRQLQLTKYNKSVDMLKEELCREPTIEEIAQEMNISEQQIKNLINNNIKTISLQTPIGDDNLEDDVLKLNLSDEIRDLFKKCKLQEIEKDDYINMLSMLKTLSFSDMIDVLSVKDAVIISLKFGYIDGKYFKTKSISDFLGIEEQEVIDTSKKILLAYKEKINTIIDNTINNPTFGQDTKSNYVFLKDKNKK